MSGTTQNLMSFGMSAQVAGILGVTPSTLTATGTSAGTAATIKSRMVDINAASSQTGAIFPTGTTIGANGLGSPGDVFFLSNNSGTTAVLYPPTGATITGASSVNLADAKNAIVWVFSPTLLFHVILA